MRTLKAHLAAMTACALVLAYPARCGAEEAARDGANLLVFVGQKVNLVERPVRCDNCLLMDSHFVATYQILDTVHGTYRGNVIDFDVYDHYGVPAFSGYETVLLFVSRRPDGSWVHEKYQFFDLNKGVDGEWYGCGDPYGMSAPERRTVHAQPVQFPAPVSYPLDRLDPQKIKRFFPAPYFEIRDGRAYCLMGTPVPGLFQAKKETVLKARGIF